MLQFEGVVMNKSSLWMRIWGLSLKLAMISVVSVVQAAENRNVYKDTILAASEKQSSCSSDQEMEEQPICVKYKRSSLQIGGDYTRVEITPKGLPSFRGNLEGAQVSYEYKPMDSFYGALRSNWKQGTTHGTDGQRKLLYIDVQERFGYTASCSCYDLLFTFFTGLGYRHLGHKFIPTVGSLLYFRYNEFYLPVGLLVDYTVNSWFAFGLEFTWMPQIYPSVSIVPLRGARWILTETLNNYFVTLPLDFTLTKNKMFHLILKPFYERWKDGHSTAVTSTGIPLALPGNTYNFWGVDVNFGFSF